MNLLSSIMVLIKAIGLKPSFDSPEAKVTVIASQTAVLPCSIENIGEFQVAWSFKKNGYHDTISWKHKMIIKDPRFSVDRPYKKAWNLKISNVRVSDEGEYKCSVNTDPISSKIIHLTVNYAPRILNTKEQVIVREGDTLSVVCNATGQPKPKVTWYIINDGDVGQKLQYTSDGEMLIIHNSTRYCQAVYECVAENGIGPQDSHQTRVIVQYPPVVYLQNSRISQIIGKMTILECQIAANPLSGSYWLKDQKPISSKQKYEFQMYEIGHDEKVLSLTIHDIEKEDFGAYTCVSENKLGRDAKTMYLAEFINPALNRITTTLTPPAPPMNGYKVESKVVRDGETSLISATPKPQADSPTNKHNKVPVESRRLNSRTSSNTTSISLVTLLILLHRGIS